MQGWLNLIEENQTKIQNALEIMYCLAGYTTELESYPCYSLILDDGGCLHLEQYPSKDTIPYLVAIDKAIEIATIKGFSLTPFLNLEKATIDEGKIAEILQTLTKTFVSESYRSLCYKYDAKNLVNF